MEKTFRIPDNSIARYELEIMSSGVCSSLAPLCFAHEQGAFVVELLLTGLTGIEAYFTTDRRLMLDGYRRLLRLLRSMAESLCNAEDYLVSPEHLSLLPENLLLEGGHVRLMPSEAPSRLEDSVKKLLISMGNRYPQTHASYILEYLPGHYDARELLRCLANLELNSAGI